MELYPQFSDTPEYSQLALQSDIVSAYILQDGAASKRVLENRASALTALQECIADDAMVAFALNTLQTIAQNDPQTAFYVAMRLLNDVPERKEGLYTFIQDVIAQLPEEDRQDAIFSVETAIISTTPEGAKLDVQEVEDNQKFRKAIAYAIQKDFATARKYQKAILEDNMKVECSLQIDSRIVRAVAATARKQDFVEARILCSLIHEEGYKVEASNQIDKYMYSAAIQAAKEKNFSYARQLQRQIVDEDIAENCSNEIDYRIALEVEKAAKGCNFPLAKLLLANIYDEDTRSRVEQTINYYIEYYSK